MCLVGLHIYYKMIHGPYSIELSNVSYRTWGLCKCCVGQCPVFEACLRKGRCKSLVCCNNLMTGSYCHRSWSHRRARPKTFGCWYSKTTTLLLCLILTDVADVKHNKIKILPIKWHSLESIDNSRRVLLVRCTAGSVQCRA